MPSIQIPQESDLQFRQTPTAMPSSPDGLLPSPSSMSSSPRSGRSRGASLNLKLDLSNLPPLEKPTTPTNTLLITDLDADCFRPENLAVIRDALNKTAPVRHFSPLKFAARIQVVFSTEQEAIAVRREWDEREVMGRPCRVCFGMQINLETINNKEDQHLALPDAGRLFFISPPPSPPHGWESRTEDAPNTMVHAEDLADALAKLRHTNDPNSGMNITQRGDISPVSPTQGGQQRTKRSRSSTLIFQPQPVVGMGGDSPNLPCVTVDDMTDEGLEDDADVMDISPVNITAPKPIMAHTARPPVELMEH
ncbi:Calcipressin-domain-containing protein [Cercophora samala]|uniref:Calcipressin-domain-containing protein n=1 Tax=Cercophora samala TaxID=330535 RepID=A0AA40DFE8_9PEZI|nr:Calcipressin-domain-containing protein [Cercophora samala]